MLFTFGVKGLLILVTLYTVPSGAVDQDSSIQLGIFKQKPSGPFYCRAKCVSMCLENEIASSIDGCTERACSNFDENTPCPHYDSKCWLNCGHRLEDDYSNPMPIQGIQATINGNEDSKTVKIDWTTQNGVPLYILEIFLVKTSFGFDEEKIVQMMTTSTSYFFQKPDMCRVYMARVMAVTADGWSTPTYKRLGGLSHSQINIDLNLKIQSIYRSHEDPSPVKVLLEYTKPTNLENNLEITDSNVRAFDCNKPIQIDSGFGYTEPDHDGFYWPLVFINDKRSQIELTFPADVMYPQCKFIYKVLEVKNQCGMTTRFGDHEKTNEIPFVLNCHTVQGAHCDDHESTVPSFKRIIDPAPSNDDSGGDMLKPFIFGKPIADKVFDPELVTGSSDQIGTPPLSPWTSQTTTNDTLWLLFENYLKGHNESDQAKDRKRIMPNAPTPLPPAPTFPQDDDQAFMKAFQESIDGPETKVTPDPSEMTSFSVGQESDIVPITEKPQISPVHVKATDDYGWTVASAMKATTPQILTFVSLVTLVLMVVIFVLWLLARRSGMRKEHFVRFA